MKELKPLREVRTAIIDKKIEEPSTNSIVEEKKESAKKILFENNSPEALVEFHLKKNALSHAAISNQPSAKIQFEAAKSFFSEETKEIAIEKETEAHVESETKKDNELEEIIQPLTNIEEEIEVEKLVDKVESVNLSEETQQVKKIKPKAGLKKRLKIIAFGFFAVLTCFLSWSIYNAVEIETLRAQLEATNKTYGINIVNYINNLSKADDLTSDSLFNLTQLSEAGIIPLEPSELEDHAEYNIKSNWFDRFCNWLSNIFK